MYLHDCNGKASRKLYPEKDALMQWHMQSGNITTNIKVKVDFTLPERSAANVVTWEYHVD